MKKQFGLPLMLASALAFSACSSDDVVENGNGSLTDFTNGGYVKMAINMPTVKSSEGAFKGVNDSYQDGTPDEYAVNNTTVIMFQGNNENDAIFHSAYNITKAWTPQPAPNGQISSILQLTKKVNEPAIGSNLYALVVVNHNGLLEVGTDHTLKVNTVGFTGNFTDFKNEVATAANVSGTNFSGAGKGLFMANAPLSKGTGGTAKSDGPVTTLVNLSSDVYPTETAAEAAPAAHIYIERGVAKVTFINPKTDASFTTDAFSNGKGVANVTYTMDGWSLDITNKESFLVRHVNPNWNAYKTDIPAVSPVPVTVANPFRFVGHTEVHDDLYRTYWAEDPNYSSTPAAAFNKVAGVADINKGFGSDKPLYCLENTFNVDNQNQDATTRAIVRVKVKINGTEGDFYTVNGGKTTLYSQANLDNLVKNAIITNADVVAANGRTAPTATAINLSYSTPDANNVQTVDGINLTLADGTLLSSKTNYNNILTAVNDAVKNITKYVNGYVYYPVRIKHFGDELTPWAQAYDATITTGKIYPATNKEERYLGRYGVVRNNWYELEVNSIKGIGYAVIPPAKNVPDDVLDQYISVKINILSWAKRKQSEKL